VINFIAFKSLLLLSQPEQFKWALTLRFGFLFSLNSRDRFRPWYLWIKRFNYFSWHHNHL